MSTVIRHGSEVHVVRPDRVYRTSVIVPFVGYQPQADVQAVAQQFTTGGPLATQLSGLGQPNWSLMGLGSPGPIKRLILKIKANMAARKARAFMFAGLSNMGHQPGPEIIVASQVAPQMQSQMAMLAHLTRFQNVGHIRGAVAEAAEALASRRPYMFYRAG